MPDVTDMPDVDEILYGLTRPLPQDGLKTPDLTGGLQGWPHQGFRPEGIEKYLAGYVRGVGPVAAAKVAAEVKGDHLVDVIDAGYRALPDRQAKELHGALTAELKDGGSTPWMHEAMMFLLGAGLDRAQARNTAFQLRQETRVELARDPYPVLLGVSGIAWGSADPVAQELGVGETDPRRRRGAVLMVLEMLAQDQGDCFAWPRYLEDQVRQACGLEPAATREAVAELEALGHLQRYERRIYLRRLLIAERVAAKELLRLTARDLAPIGGVELDGLGDDQRAAVEAITRAPVSVLTGGPGTGKTFSVARIARAAVAAGMDVGLCALAGRAAARMAEVSGLSAMTIHRMLGYGGFMPDLWDDQALYNPGDVVEYGGVAWRAVSVPDGVPGEDEAWQKANDNGGPRHGAREPDVPADLLIVDETSMLGVELAARLLREVPDTCRVLFVGDVDQLPAIDPGNFMSDLMEHPRVRVNRLEKVWRQEGDSMIPVRAREIRLGEPLVDQWGRSEATAEGMRLVSAPDDETAARMVRALVTEQIPEIYGVRPDQVQVLTAMRTRGVISANALNVMLRRKLNPGSDSPNLRVGDRVMETRNNYALERWNGDIGDVTAVDRQTVTVRFHVDGEETEYPRKASRSLALAWASTIHKAQGSEFPVCVVVVSSSQHVLLQRNLLYTAVTRAKRACIVVATPGAVERAAATVRNDHRKSGLRSMFETVADDEAAKDRYQELLASSPLPAAVPNGIQTPTGTDEPDLYEDGPPEGWDAEADEAQASYYEQLLHQGGAV